MLKLYILIAVVGLVGGVVYEGGIIIKTLNLIFRFLLKISKKS
jgi:hypothetical protein